MSSILTSATMRHDDQALVSNIKHKGLVIITGCGHAGIIYLLPRGVVERRTSPSFTHDIVLAEYTNAS
jgi:metal-dependent hydrolase (beta-lactamase superfamily II)